MRTPLEIWAEYTTKDRPCGDCTACCTVLAVKELGKPFYTKCEHECGKCLIYEDRPQSCRECYCGWKVDIGELNQRPDKLGLLFDIEIGRDDQPWLFIYETKPNIWAELTEDALRDWLIKASKKLGDFSGVCLHRFGDKIGLSFSPNEKYPLSFEWNQERSYSSDDNFVFTYQNP